jgi:histone-lysine N-methyltransferase SETMAR
VPENVDIVHSKILADRRVSAKKIAQALEISRKRVGYIIHDVLDMRKLSAEWVPKCFNANQKRDRVVASRTILEQFRRNTAGFLARLVTTDETWIYLYDSETKEQSKKWGQ